MSLIVFAALTAASELGALAYLLCTRAAAKAGKRSFSLRRCLFLLLCPVIAPLYLAASRLIYLLLYSRRPKLRLKAEFKGEAESLTLPDSDTELNVVPIEEALFISNKSDLRRLLLNLLKDGIDSSLDAVALALESDDSEASHYSASAIADALARFQEKARQLTEKMEADPANSAVIGELIEHMLWFMSKSILSERERSMYLTRTSGYLEKMLQIAPEEVPASYLSKLSELCLGVNAPEMAGMWAQRCAELYPDTLETYTANLRCCFAAEDSTGFHRWLDALKHSSVIVDKELLDLIHAFG